MSDNSRKWENDENSNALSLIARVGMLFLTFSLIVCSIASSAAQQHNVTLDDTDPAIVYSPPEGWGRTKPSRFDVGGTHKLTSSQSATATLTFTGIAVYFMSPLWPYTVTTQVQLDDRTPDFLDLTDPNSSPAEPNGGEETVQSAVVWWVEDLANTTHTLRVSAGGGQFGVVDTIIYTVLDAAPPPSSSAQSTTSSEPSSTAQRDTNSPTTSITLSTPQNTSTTSSGGALGDNGSSSSNHVLPIALGTALGVLAVLVVVFALLFFCRARKRPTSEAWTVTGASPQVMDPPPGPFSPHLQGYYTHDSLRSAYQQSYGSKHSLGASGPELDPLMAGVGGPPIASTQPDAYYSVNQCTQDFNPWMSLQAQPSGPPNHQRDPYPSQPSLSSSTQYEQTTLSTITETSTLGTLSERKSRLTPSPASLPPTNLAYYSPQEKGNSIRLSYVSDTSAGASGAAAYQYQPLHPSGSTRQSWSQGPSLNGAQLKLTQESGPLLAVNRLEEGSTSEGSHPPAYTPH